MEKWMIVPYRNGVPQKPLVAPSLREAIEWCQRGSLKPPLPFRPLEEVDGKDVVLGKMITPGEGKGVCMGDPLGDGRFVLRYRIAPVPVVGCVSAVVLHDLHPFEDAGAMWIHHRPVTVYQLPGPPAGEAVLDVMADHLRTWARGMEELDLPGPWTLHVWTCSTWNMQAIQVTAHRPSLEELQEILAEGPPDPDRLVVALFHEHAPDRLREGWPVRLGNQPLDWLPLAVASLHQDGFPVRLSAMP